MTTHELSAQIASHAIALLAAIGLVFTICYAPTKDEADDQAARTHAEQQARAAAQPDTWAGLDREGKQMVAYDWIKK